MSGLQWDLILIGVGALCLWYDRRVRRVNPHIHVCGVCGRAFRPPHIVLVANARCGYYWLCRACYERWWAVES